MTYPAPIFQALLVALVLLAGVWDLRARRIPNWLVLCGFACGCGMNAFLFGAQGMWFALKGAGLALLIYVPLFALRAMGAGDAKLMAAVGSIVGPGNWLAVFFMTAVLGGILGIMVIVSKKRFSRTMANIVRILRELAYFRAPYLQHEELSAGHENAVSLPHGAVITLSSMLFLLIVTLWAPR